MAKANRLIAEAKKRKRDNTGFTLEDRLSDKQLVELAELIDWFDSAPGIERPSLRELTKIINEQFGTTFHYTTIIGWRNRRAKK